MQEITLGNNKITETKWVIDLTARVVCECGSQNLSPVLGHEWGDLWHCNDCDTTHNWLDKGYKCVTLAS